LAAVVGLAWGKRWVYGRAVSTLLRLIGVMNAVVWFGGSLFFTLAVAPTFFTAEVKQVFSDAYAGWIAQKVMERFYLLQLWCGAIAVAHQLAERVYLGRVLPRLSLYVLAGVIAVGLTGGLWLQPKLTRLHQTVYREELYRQAVTPAQRQQAQRAFRLWHGLAQGLNVLALIGLGYYTWRVMNPPDPTRYISAAKFRY
jgi:uncharacterized membrane protein